jgi:membrane dipeptidase
VDASGQELNAPYMYGIESPEEWPNITRGLVSRGYSDEEIKKIIGSNALRIIEQVIG